MATRNTKNSIASLLIVVLLVVGLGVGYVRGMSTVSPTTITSTITSTAQQGRLASFDIAIVRGSSGRLGSDDLTHDTFIPANFSVYAGQNVTVTVVNYDEGPHMITSLALGVSFQILGDKATGVPSVTQFHLLATKAGVYRWFCVDPCDAGQKGWAMTNGSDGQLGQIGFMGGFITVLSV